MKNWAANIINSVENSVDNKNFKGLKICTVKTIKPLVFTYEGVDLGTSEGDLVYVHPLMVAESISQDVEKLLEIQSFKNSTAYNSPEFEASIEGSIPNFIKEFYIFYKNWQAVYLLNVGDLIAVYEFGNNTYLILQKIAQDVLAVNKEKE